jgi:FHA domain
MISCRNCQSPNLHGAVFCVECGALLPLGSTSATPESAGDPSGGSTSPVGDSIRSTAAASSHWATLHVLEGGQELALADRDEFTLGRKAERQPALPDIDFSPFQGYPNGVSRLHAIIRRRGNRVLLKDLNSANGTYVNGRRLPPGREEPLANGDVIALGKLKIQVRIGTA